MCVCVFVYLYVLYIILIFIINSSDLGASVVMFEERMEISVRYTNSVPCSNIIMGPTVITSC